MAPYETRSKARKAAQEALQSTVVSRRPAAKVKPSGSGSRKRATPPPVVRIVAIDDSQPPGSSSGLSDEQHHHQLMPMDDGDVEFDSDESTDDEEALFDEIHSATMDDVRERFKILLEYNKRNTDAFMMVAERVGSIVEKLGPLIENQSNLIAELNMKLNAGLINLN